MYNIEEFDEQKTKVLKYILFKKRTEQEVRNKFSKTISEELLNDIIDYENRDEMEEYEKISEANILYKKQGSAEPEEIIQYLMKKGYKTENIRKAISEMEEG